ncbi:hypothetical protein JCM6882_002125 [Rhodosporidiobolus microsporus]
MPALFFTPSRSTLFALCLAALLFFQLLVGGAAAQGLTTLTEEDNGAIVTTSISPTVYTTSDQIFTWTPSTPPTPTPTIVSHGSVMNIQDYISTVSGSGAAAATAAGENRNFKQNVANANGAAGGVSAPGAWAAAAVLGGVAGVMVRL